MHSITIPDSLWASTMLPEGILESWKVRSGDEVALGQPLANVRIEDAVHTLPSPASGRVIVGVAEGTVIEPGRLIGFIGSAA